jgi:hypothetical protein
MKRSLLLVSAIFFSFWQGAAGAAVTTEVFTGKAVNEKGELEYVENHTITYESDMVVRSRTLYFDPGNRMIGEFVSEYLSSPQFNSYSFKDMRARYEDGVTVEGDRLKLFRKKSPESDLESDFLPMQTNQIVGQGFHHFLRLNLETIAGGEIFHIKLVLPSRLDQYSFRIRKLKIEDRVLAIRLEIDNWFLRLFAPCVDCEYDMTTKRLLRYTGISNLEDASGSHGKVDIVYTY